jgi:hypothetical protein
VVVGVLPVLFGVDVSEEGLSARLLKVPFRLYLFYSQLRPLYDQKSEERRKKDEFDGRNQSPEEHYYSIRVFIS